MGGSRLLQRKSVVRSVASAFYRPRSCCATPSGGGGRMAIHIRRREFIFTLGGAAAAWPRAARAQQARKIPRIGGLWPNPPATFEFMRQGLQDFGYVEGRNIGFEFRWAEGKLDR